MFFLSKVLRVFQRGLLLKKDNDYQDFCIQASQFHFEHPLGASDPEILGNPTKDRGKENQGNPNPMNGLIKKDIHNMFSSHFELDERF